MPAGRRETEIFRDGTSRFRRKVLGGGWPYLCFRCDYWFRGELHVGGLQDGVLLQDVLLGLVVAKRLESRDQREKVNLRKDFKCVSSSLKKKCFEDSGLALLLRVSPTLRPYKHW